MWSLLLFILLLFICWGFWLFSLLGVEFGFVSIVSLSFVKLYNLHPHKYNLFSNDICDIPSKSNWLYSILCSINISDSTSYIWRYNIDDVFAEKSSVYDEYVSVYFAFSFIFPILFIILINFFEFGFILFL